MKEYDVGVKHEKSALEKFADKYWSNWGKPEIVRLEYFKDNYLLSSRILWEIMEA